MGGFKVHDFWQVIRGDGFLETPFSPRRKGRRGAPLVEEGGVVISDFKIEHSFNRNFQKGKRIGTQPKLQETGRIGGENTAGEKQVREGGTPSGDLRGYTSQAGAV